VSIYPADYYEDGIADWKELRDFLLRVADKVRAILESQNNDSAAQASGGGVRCQKSGKSTK
jgi:exonuclease VII small subunit